MNVETGEVKLTSEIKPQEEHMFVPAPFITGTQIKNKKIGRNETCPCGSGKKFKKCCLDSKLDNRGDKLPELPWQIVAEEDINPETETE